MVLAIFKKIKYHSVTRNAASLGVMQIANYVVPLLLLPFLTRKLGLEAFGVMAVTMAAIQFAFVLTDYGFTLSATYSISLNRDNPEFISRKIGSVFGAKVFLVCLVMLSLLLVPISFPAFSEYANFFTAALIASVAQAFQPIWLFQGVERMRNISIYAVATKVLYALLVLLLVREPDDALLVIYCWGVAQIVGLYLSLYFMHSEGYKIIMPSLYAVKEELKEGAQFFWSRLAVAMYTSASTLILGAHGTTQAASFAVCEQIYKAGQNVTSPINNAMYPYMAKNKDWTVFFKIMTVTSLVMVAGCFALAIFADSLLNILFGEEYIAATPVLLVFLCTSVINYFTVTFGYAAFAALGRVGIANVSVMAGAVVYAVILSIQYAFFEINALNVAIAILATETVVMSVRICAFCMIKKK